MDKANTNNKPLLNKNKKIKIDDEKRIFHGDVQKARIEKFAFTEKE